MPIYLMGCDKCGHEEDLYRSIAKMDEDLPLCCGIKMHRKITAPAVANDIQPYKSMIDGRMINSRSEHRSHLKAHGCIEVGNETNNIKPRKPLESPPGLKDQLIRAVNEKMR